MKRIVKCKILSNDKLVKDIYKMQIEVDFAETVKAGQFVNVYLDDKSLLLPRPISICNADSNSITIVYKVVGKGTKLISKYGEGAEIQISTPLGNGYLIENSSFLSEESNDSKVVNGYRDKKVVLVGGGIGVPPMLLLAKKLKEKGADVVAALGFQEEVFLIDELEKYCSNVYVATDNGSTGYHGNAVQMIKEKQILGDEYFACGPKVMLKVLSEYCIEKKLPCQVSLEERMGCGYGACVGCTCKIKVKTTAGIEIQQKGVCKNGPVFFGEEVAWDE